MGGITTFTKKQFYAVNGYSNSYWGWGAEDTDLSARVRTFYKLKNVPRPKNSTKYHIYQIEHKRDANNQKNPKRAQILKNWKRRWHHDGIKVRYPAELYLICTLELEELGSYRHVLHKILYQHHCTSLIYCQSDSF